MNETRDENRGEPEVLPLLQLMAIWTADRSFRRPQVSNCDLNSFAQPRKSPPRKPIYRKERSRNCLVIWSRHTRYHLTPEYRRDMGPKPAAPERGNAPGNRHNHRGLFQHLAYDRAIKGLLIVRPSPWNLPGARAESMDQKHFGKFRCSMA
jgi:hypothetical protein